MTPDDTPVPEIRAEDLPLFQGMKILFDDKTGLYPVNVIHDDTDDRQPDRE